MNKHLKLTQRNYVGYTGQIGRWNFVDGVSVEPIPPIERIRISANFGVVELGEDGEDQGSPSPSHSVVANHRVRAELRAPLSRQSDEDKAAESIQIVMGSEEKKTLLSREALEEVASDSGIAGLREIAANWNVRSKSIPVLMQMILDAQAAYAAAKRATLLERGIPVEEIERILTPISQAPKLESRLARAVVKKVQPEVPDADLAQAAATGDMAAALNVSTVASPE
jgi:hypothetical protein